MEEDSFVGHRSKSQGMHFYTHTFTRPVHNTDVELKHEKRVVRSVFHVNFSHSHTVVAAQNQHIPFAVNPHQG